MAFLSMAWADALKRTPFSSTRLLVSFGRSMSSNLNKVEKGTLGQGFFFFE